MWHRLVWEASRKIYLSCGETLLQGSPAPHSDTGEMAALETDGWVSLPPCSEHPALLGGVTSPAQRAGLGPKSRLMSSARQIFFQCCFVEELPPQRPSVTLENISPDFLSSPYWPTPSSPASGFSSGKPRLTRCPPCASTARRTHLALRSFTLVAPSSGSVHLPGGMFPEASVQGTGEGAQGMAAPPGHHGDQTPFPSRERPLPFFPMHWGAPPNPQCPLTPEASCGRERAKGVWADPGWDLCFAIG